MSCVHILLTMLCLRYRADLRSLATLLAILGYLGWCWLAVDWSAPMIVCGVLVGAGGAFIGNIINHNHQHLPMARHAWANEIISVLISLAVGFPASGIRAMHNGNHHRHHGGPEDLLRPDRLDWRRRWAVLLCYAGACMPEYRRRRRAFLAEECSHHPGLIRELWTQRLVLYPALVALVVWDPLSTLLAIVLPWVLGQWLIITVNLLQHDGCDPDSRHDHSRNITARMFNYLLFNNGFHTAHHLRPGLHWSELPALHRDISDDIDPRLNHRSVLALLWTRFRPGLSG